MRGFVAVALAVAVAVALGVVLLAATGDGLGPTYTVGGETFTVDFPTAPAHGLTLDPRTGAVTAQFVAASGATTYAVALWPSRLGPRLAAAALLDGCRAHQPACVPGVWTGYEVPPPCAALARHAQLGGHGAKVFTVALGGGRCYAAARVDVHGTEVSLVADRATPGAIERFFASFALLG